MHARRHLWLVPAILLLLSPDARSQAISYGGDIGSGCATIPPGGGPLVITTAGFIAGPPSTVILSVTTTDTIVDMPLVTVFDTAGNPWITDASIAGSSSLTAFLASSRLVVPIAPGMTITLAFANGSSSQTACAVASVFDNLLTGPGWFDQTGNGSGSSTTPSATTGGATAQPNELVVGVTASNQAFTFTPGAGYLGTATSACSGASLCAYPEYEIVSATGSQTANGTLSSTGIWTELVGTYKGTLFPVELQKLTIE